MDVKNAEMELEDYAKANGLTLITYRDMQGSTVYELWADEGRVWEDNGCNTLCQSWSNENDALNAVISLIERATLGTDSVYLR